MKKNNYFFTYQNTEQQEACSCNLCIIARNNILEETKNSNLFDKKCTQENVKCHVQHEES